MTQAPTPGPLSGDFSVEEYVAEYEFRGDEGCHTPDDDERALITDAIHGYLSEASYRLAPTAPVEASGSELLPCPFCGGEAEIVHLDDGDNVGGSCVCCTKCQASGNVEFGRKENFVENWNRRAALRPQPSGETREDRLSAALIAMVEHFERVDAAPEDKAAIQAACEVWAGVKRDTALSITPARAEAQDGGAVGRVNSDISPLLDHHRLGIDREDLPRPSPTPAAQDDDRVLKPNLFWSAEGWEYTHSDLTEAYEEATGGTNSGVVKIGNALELPAIWAVQIDIDTTGDGEADDYEIKTFPTKEEADAYLADALKSTAAKEGGAA